MESWGTGSVASQTKGMINYATAVTVHYQMQLISALATVGGKI